jgi:hypothetical protein
MAGNGDIFKKYAPLVGMGAKALGAAWEAIHDDFYEWMEATATEETTSTIDPAYEQFLNKNGAKLVDGNPGLPDSSIPSVGEGLKMEDVIIK